MKYYFKPLFLLTIEKFYVIRLIMPGENTVPQSITQRIESEISEIWQIYKIPIICIISGSILLLAAFILLLNTSSSKSDVVFSSATESAKMTIAVEIAGAVIQPNVYSMQEGSRINDLLVKAGGLSADADRSWVEKSVNKAAKLTDGAKIYIPTIGEISSGKSSLFSNLNSSGSLLGVTTEKTNINTASQTELEKLPGIGPVTAGKIIAARPYQSVEDLKTKKIIGNAVYEKIKDLISVY